VDVQNPNSSSGLDNPDYNLDVRSQQNNDE